MELLPLACWELGLNRYAVLPGVEKVASFGKGPCFCAVSKFGRSLLILPCGRVLADDA
jgi:hypothetical protein